MALSSKTYDVSPNEVLEIISKQWCSTTDFMKLAGCTKSMGYKYICRMKTQLDKKKIFYPTGLLPMTEVVKFLNIDANKLVEDIKRLKELSN